LNIREDKRVKTALARTLIKILEPRKATEKLQDAIRPKKIPEETLA
jgi:hypothetical protein